MDYNKMLDDIEKNLKKLKSKKSRTNIIDKNKEYKNLCYQIGLLEQQKENILRIIQNEGQKK